MQSELSKSAPRIVVLGTGGTIAGRAARADDNVGYRAGQVGVEALVAAIPPLAEVPLECEQVAQLDSKDMDFETWQRLAVRAARHLERPEVQGAVVTHGTDTLEETAWLLARVVAPATKPLVLTAAMRPATAVAPDGPRNLLDAVLLARESGARGTMVMMAGEVFDAQGVRKRHTYRLDAFSGGDAGPLGVMLEGRLRRFRDWPATPRVPHGAGLLPGEASRWPRVEIVLNHAGADGETVRAWLARGGLDGLVVAGTGNGTVSLRLEAALAEAAAAGVAVRFASRCAAGPVLRRDSAPGGHAPAELSAVQLRVELLLELLVARRARR